MKMQTPDQTLLAPASLGRQLRSLAGAATLLLAAARAAPPTDMAPVLPGGTGFGLDTPAGRGGAILRVTTLAADGPGSLRAALAATGPRVVLFEVAGVIDLNGAPLTVTEPFLTVAGQSAPPPGITLIRGGLSIQTHDVLMQHIRVRPGDAGRARRSGWEPDGLSTSNPAGQPGAHHIVIDHCSFTWAVDENLSASGQRHEGPGGTAHQVTFSNCIIAEGLNDSSHAKGPHSKGTLIHDHARDIAIIGNLYACNVERNPVLKPGAAAVIVNNLIYNPGKRAIHSYWTPNEYKGQPEGPKPCTLTVLGNVLWYGPDTPAGMPLVFIANNQGAVHAADNLALDAAGQPVTLVAGSPRLLAEPPALPPGLRPLPSTATPEHVLTHAGAWPAQRDAVDQRIVAGVRARTGRILDSQEQVGGYPRVAPVSRPLSLPHDPHGDADGDGYTNLEEWLHAQAAQVEGRH